MTSCKQLLFTAPSMSEMALYSGAVALMSFAEMPEMLAMLILGGYWLVFNQTRKMCRLSGPGLSRNLEHLAAKAPSAEYVAAVLVVVIVVSLLSGFINAALAFTSALAYLGLYKVGEERGTKGIAAKSGHASACVDPIHGNNKKLGAWLDGGLAKPKQSALQLTVQRKCSKPAPSSSPGSINSGTLTPKARQPPGEMPANLEAAVQRVVCRSTPTHADHEVASRLVGAARKCLLPILPEMEVMGFPTGNLAMIGETGEKPEIEMIVTMEPELLAQRLKEFFAQGKGRIPKSAESLQADNLVKTATKVLSERLTFVRYWRTQLTGPTCMVVLLVPENTGFGDRPMLLNFYVNAVYPMRLSSMLAKSSSCCRGLICMVLRWTRERSIVNEARGQLNKYAWTLLVVYFHRHRSTFGKIEDATSVAGLFKEFVDFYADWFDRPDTSVVVTFVARDVEVPPEKQMLGLPYVEDPHEPGVDIAAPASADGIRRTKTELTRAREMLAQDSPLAAVLEKWMPPTTLRPI